MAGNEESLTPQKFKERDSPVSWRGMRCNCGQLLRERGDRGRKSVEPELVGSRAIIQSVAP